MALMTADDSDFLFSTSRKRFYDSAYVSVACETSLKRTNVGCPVIYSPACFLNVSSVHPLNLLSLCLLLLSTMVKESKKGK